MKKFLFGTRHSDLKNALNIEKPDFGFSLRDLTGNNNICVRVRRTIDNNQQDFRPSEITDGSLYSFVGGDYNGYVTRWYNQFNVSQFYDQPVQAFQPQIAIEAGGGVFANKVTTDGQPNSIPTIDFGGFGYVPNAFLEGTSYEPHRDILIVAVVKPADIDPVDDGYIFDNFTSSGRGLLQDNFANGTYTFINDTTSSTPDRLRADVIDKSLVVITARIKSDEINIANNQFEIYLNGVLANSDNGRLLAYQPRSGESLIGAGTGSGTDSFKGKIYELLIYRGNNLDHTQKLVEKNVINYYERDFNK